MYIKKSYLNYLLLLTPFFMSNIVYTQTVKSFAQFLLICKFFIFIYVVVHYFSINKFSKLDCAVCIYFLIWVISAIVNGSAIIDILKEIVTILSLMLIIEESFIKDKHNEMMTAMTHIVFVEMFINFIGILAFPNGLWKTTSIYGDVAIYNFLGLDNQTTPIVLIAITLCMLKLKKNDYKLNIFILLFVGIILGNIILMKSGTCISGVLVIMLLLLLGRKNKEFINARSIMILMGIVFLGFVIFRVQDIFSFFIESFLKKDLTFSNRTGIWDRAIELIKLKPLLGYGCETFAKIIIDRNSHDYYLQIMLQSGLVGFIAYLNIIRIALKNCNVHKDLDVSMIINSCLCGYMICAIFEVYAQFWLILFLVLAYNVTRINDNEINKKYIGER